MSAIKSWLIFPATDTHYAFCQGIFSIPSDDQLDRLSKNGITVSLSQPALPKVKKEKQPT